MTKRSPQMLVLAGLCALGVIVLLVGLLAAVMPQRSKASSIDGQIATAQVQLTSLRAGGRRSAAIRAAELFQLARAMPADDDMPGVLLELAHLADASSVTLVSVTPDSSVTLSDGASALPISLVVDGRWSSLSSYLRRLRGEVQVHGSKLRVGGRLFVVDGVSLATGQTSEVEATLNLVAFHYGTPVASLPSGNATSPAATSSPGIAEAAGSTGGAG